MEQVVCGQVVCERKEEEALGGGGRRRRDTEPKTRTPHKDVGNNGVTVLPSASKNVSVCCSSSCLFKFPKIACNHTKNAANTNHVLLPTARTSSNNLNHKHKSHTSKRHVFRTLQIHIAFQSAGLPVCNQPYPHPNIQQPAVRI